MHIGKGYATLLVPPHLHLVYMEAAEQTVTECLVEIPTSELKNNSSLSLGLSLLHRDTMVAWRLVSETGYIAERAPDYFGENIIQYALGVK